MNIRVDEFISKSKQWKEELLLLQAICLDCGLTEDFKWRYPCYTSNGKNIVLLGTFKDYCSMSFFKGVLLQDDQHILVSPGANSQSVRMIKLTSTRDIQKLKKTITSYIYEAVEVERQGIVIDKPLSTHLEYPEELKSKMEIDPPFREAFLSLTLGRQRAYNIYFSSAKQSVTRTERIQRYAQRILDGYGINDCVCGLSQRMPGCDGSHKILE